MAIKNKYKGELVQSLVSLLTEDGARAIEYAYVKRGYTNRLYNLHDSYGSAVYVDGVLDKSTLRYLNPEMRKSGRNFGWVWTKGRSMPDFRGERRLEGDELEMKGRDEVMDFFEQYKAPKGTICLVVVAAMFYASILEQGGGNLKRKYAVISGAKTTLSNTFAFQNGLGTIERLPAMSRLLNVPSTIKNQSWKQ